MPGHRQAIVLNRVRQSRKTRRRCMRRRVLLITATPRKGLRERSASFASGMKGRDGCIKRALKPMYNFDELDATGSGKIHFVTIAALSRTNTKIIFARLQHGNSRLPELRRCLIGTVSSLRIEHDPHATRRPRRCRRSSSKPMPKPHRRKCGKMESVSTDRSIFHDSLVVSRWIVIWEWTG